MGDQALPGATEIGAARVGGGGRCPAGTPPDGMAGSKDGDSVVPEEEEHTLEVLLVEIVCSLQQANNNNPVQFIYKAPGHNKSSQGGEQRGDGNVLLNHLDLYMNDQNLPLTS